MTDTKTLEELKDPKKAQAFGIYKEFHPEKFTILEKAGETNCMHFLGKWLSSEDSPFCDELTYILKPDYQPEPEYVDLEIVKYDGWYGVISNYDQSFPHHFTHLHCLSSLAGFHRFHCSVKDAPDDVASMRNVQTNHVAFVIEVKKGTVFARFRGES